MGIYPSPGQSAGGNTYAIWVWSSGWLPGKEEGWAVVLPLLLLLLFV